MIRKSIRIEDEAFRWGGDEFVVLFRNQHLEVAQGGGCARSSPDGLPDSRLRTISAGLSWGASEGTGGPLKPVLEQADLQMYQYKRRTHAKDA